MASTQPMVILGRASFWYEQWPNSQNERNWNGRRSKGFVRTYLQWSSLLGCPEVPSERRQVESQSLTSTVRMGSFPWAKHNFIPHLRVWRDKAEAVKLPPVLPLLNFKPWKGLLRQTRQDLELQNIDCYNTERKEKHWKQLSQQIIVKLKQKTNSITGYNFFASVLQVATWGKKLLAVHK